MPALNFNLKVFYSLLKTKSWKPLIVLCNKHQTVSNRKIKKEGWKKIVLGVGQFFFSVSAVNKFVLSPFPEPKLMTNSWILYFLLLSHVLGFLSRIVAKSDLDQRYSMPVIWQIWQRMIERALTHQSTKATNHHLTKAPKDDRMSSNRVLLNKAIVSGLVAPQSTCSSAKIKSLNPMRKHLRIWLYIYARLWLN